MIGAAPNEHKKEHSLQPNNQTNDLHLVVDTFIGYSGMLVVG